MLRILILIFTSIIFCFTQEELELLCSEDFCKDYLSNTDTPCNVPKFCVDPEDVSSIMEIPSLVPCNCCNYCLQKLEEGSHCDIGEPGFSSSNSLCGDGLKCDNVTLTCVPMDTPCVKEQISYDEKKANGTLGHLEIRPNCDEHGYYKPYVCIPNEICYCVDKNGKRIFGEIKFTTLADIIMKCECSRSYASTEEKFYDDDFHIISHFRCESNGDYDEIQCLDEENCYCVDKEDGVPSFPNFPPFPMANMTAGTDGIVPCLTKNDTDLLEKYTKYYRPCEKLYYEIIDEELEFKDSDIEVIGLVLPHCQPDGYFAAVQEDEKRKYCAHPNGDIIGEYEIFINDDPNDPLLLNMNCNCARATSIMEEDSMEKPVCLKNGNYNPIQCRRGLCRCVDENGNQIKKEIDFDELEPNFCD